MHGVKGTLCYRHKGISTPKARAVPLFIHSLLSCAPRAAPPSTFHYELYFPLSFTCLEKETYSQYAKQETSITSSTREYQDTYKERQDHAPQRLPSARAKGLWLVLFFSSKRNVTGRLRLEEVPGVGTSKETER